MGVLQSVNFRRKRRPGAGISSQSQRIIVVGAGPGGLAAAAILAKAGLDVTVIERREHSGGRTATFSEAGFKFDIGPTFFHYPQVLEGIFASLGFDLWKEVDLRRLDPQYRLVFGAGGDLLATPVVEKMRAEIANLSPRDAEHFETFLRDNRRKLTRFRPFLEKSFGSWREAVSRDILQLLPLIRPWKSLDAELRRYFSDERIRLAFSFQSKYLGMSPFQCPSLFSILSFLEYEFGVFHPIGGCGALTQALTRVGETLGVKYRFGEAVTQILFQGARAIGVATEAGEYRANAVVINADFARAIQRLVPDYLRKSWSDANIERKRMSCSGFMLYLGIDGLYKNVPHHTIYIAKDYARNMDEIENRHVLSADPSYYLQNAGVTDPTLAPKGQSTLYVLVPVTHGHTNVDWSREAAGYRALVLDKLAAVGVTDVASRIVYERMVTPEDWDGAFELHHGSLFSLAHNWSQMLHLRPHNRFDELESVYLVGGGTHPGSGLPVIFESARISSRLLLSDLGVRVHAEIDAPDPALAGVA